MLGFRMSKGPAPRKDPIDAILARHKANMAAERKPATRSDPPAASEASRVRTAGREFLTPPRLANQGRSRSPSRLSTSSEPSLPTREWFFRRAPGWEGLAERPKTRRTLRKPL
jgi:hypothetical protein